MATNFHGQWSLVGYSPWACKESDMTEQLALHCHFTCYSGAPLFIEDTFQDLLDAYIMDSTEPYVNYVFS